MRQIIKIDEEKCNGCGLCAAACAEGAIQMVEGKARLVSEVFCDGLGACLGECPVGAISIEQRDAAPYSERETLEQLLKQGMKVVALHLAHLKNHGQTRFYEEGVAVLKEKGIPVPDLSGDAVIPHTASPDTAFANLSKPVLTLAQHSATQPFPLASCPSSAEQMGKRNTNWPIQLQLINPDSSVFDDAQLVIAADCTAFAYPEFYRNFTLNNVLIVFCPKLDHATEIYVEKLAAIFSRHSIRSITLLRMLVPCCGGTSMIVRQALAQSGKNIEIVEHIVQFDGTLKNS